MKTFRLGSGSGFGLNIERPSDGGGIVAEVGFGESIDCQLPERKEGQEHIGIDVGHDGVAIHRRGAGEVARAEQSLFLTGHGDEEDRAFEGNLVFLEPRATTSRSAATPEALSIAPL